jgi:hypothetical protein
MPNLQLVAEAWHASASSDTLRLGVPGDSSRCTFCYSALVRLEDPSQDKQLFQEVEMARLTAFHFEPVTQPEDIPELRSRLLYMHHAGPGATVSSTAAEAAAAAVLESGASQVSRHGASSARIRLGVCSG